MRAKAFIWYNKGMKVPRFFGGKRNTHVGVDIGTSSVKVVELLRQGSRVALETYGQILTPRYLEQVEHPLQMVSPKVLDTDVAGLIREILHEARVGGKHVSLSIPVFSSFFSLLEFPKMGDKELAQAVPFQARQIVPVPISEVELGWEVVGQQKRAAEHAQQQERFLVLIVAVPREVIDKLERISKAAGMMLDGLEVETFSLARALVGEQSDTVLLADIGARATSLSIIDEGTIRSSQVSDIGSAEFTRAISSSLGVTAARAEAMKMEQGITAQGGEEAAARAVKTVLEGMVGDFEKASASYFRKYGRKVVRAILSGASAHMPGFVEFVAERLGRSCEVAYPFMHIAHPEMLTPTLHEIGPSFAVATGLALRGIQKK